MSKLLSVIMTVYNGEPYLHDAVASLLRQSYYDFELIVVDNGSTDNSLQVLRSFDDPRLCIIELGRNIGRTPALNVALEAARGDYVAVQDADDISQPLRLEKQMAYMAQHSHVVLLGTWCQFIDEGGNLGKRFRPPTSHQAIVDLFVTKNPFAHSSVLFQRAPVQEMGGYPVDYLYSQDFALWLQIIRQYQVANLPEELVQIRLHANQTTWSANMKTVRWWDLLRVYRDALVHLDLSPQARKAGQRTVAQTMLDYAKALSQEGRQGAALRWVGTVCLHYPHLCVRDVSIIAQIIQMVFGQRGYEVVCNVKRGLYRVLPMQS